MNGSQEEPNHKLIWIINGKWNESVKVNLLFSITEKDIFAIVFCCFDERGLTIGLNR